MKDIKMPFDPNIISDNITIADKGLSLWKRDSDLYTISSEISNRSCSQHLLQALFNISLRHELILPHPTKAEIETFPIVSKGYPNHTILFVDKDVSSPWILLQVFNFWDMAITPEGVVCPLEIPLSRNKAVIKAACDFANSALTSIVANISDDKGVTNKPLYRGFLLNADRPFHFVFDELLTFIMIRHNIDPYFNAAFGQFSYVYDKTFGSQVIDSLSAKSNQKYIYLRLKGVGVHVQNGNQVLYDSFQLLGQQILSLEPSTLVPQVLDESFVLWLGITGQKRSWIEQIEGYALIISTYNRIFPRLTVIIDGWTQPNSQSTQITVEDLSIAISIIDRVSTYSEIKVIVAIDMDYKQKIRLCDKVNLFIANHGSGCIIPHILLRKPGVLHSPYTDKGPKDAMNFPHINPSHALQVPASDVTVLNMTAGLTPQSCSYSIRPSVMLAISLSLINQHKASNGAINSIAARDNTLGNCNEFTDESTKRNYFNLKQALSSAKSGSSISASHLIRELLLESRVIDLVSVPKYNTRLRE